jgi:hypothetical protein
MWLVGLLNAFDSVTQEREPVDADLLCNVERHLRENARVTAKASTRYH